MDPGVSDVVYQDQILPHVSRTFALTIPQLPGALRIAVTNAYLLCRIADTIEDEPALSPVETLSFMQRFMEVVAGRGEPDALAQALRTRLSDRTLETEHALVSQMRRVINVTAALSPAQRAAIHRCVELMCYGMPRFQSTASLRGLPRLADLDEYCYYVAGVVGDMLTELFCEYSPAIARNRPGLQSLAVSFAQGLQMTNILKDVWEDRSPRRLLVARRRCLPRVTASTWRRFQCRQPFDRRVSMRRMARTRRPSRTRHLRNALDYTLLIPAARRPGIRRFLPLGHRSC